MFWESCFLLKTLVRVNSFLLIHQKYYVMGLQTLQIQVYIVAVKSHRHIFPLKPQTVFRNTALQQSFFFSVFSFIKTTKSVGPKCINEKHNVKSSIFLKFKCFSSRDEFLSGHERRNTSASETTEAVEREREKSERRTINTYKWTYVRANCAMGLIYCEPVASASDTREGQAGRGKGLQIMGSFQGGSVCGIIHSRVCAIQD